LRRLGDIEGHVYNIGWSNYPRYAYDTSTGATLSVTLDLSASSKGRSHIIVCVKSSSTGSFKVYGSHDNSRWWLIDTIDYPEANKDVTRTYINAFPYIKCETNIVADNEILICASR